MEYSYLNKKDNLLVRAQKFDGWLVGQNPQEYCIGYVEGTKAVCSEAKDK